MGILWLIIIGFVAGIIAKFLHPGSNEPSGLILTTALGIAGAFVATYLGQALGWYHAAEGAGLIGAVLILLGRAFADTVRDARHPRWIVGGLVALAGAIVVLTYLGVELPRE